MVKKFCLLFQLEELFYKLIYRGQSNGENLKKSFFSDRQHSHHRTHAATHFVSFHKEHPGVNFIFFFKK
jgi:hypothetical protein